MNRVQLRQIIKEVVVRKLRELDMNKPGVTGDSKPDASKLTDAEQKKLEDLNKEAADLTAQQQELEGKKADLQGTIERQVNTLDIKNRRTTEQLGNVRRKIEQIKARA